MINGRKTSKPRVMFLCRGSTKDGIGHVIRSRTLAASMLDKIEIKFIIIGEPYIKNLLLNTGIDSLIVKTEQEAVPVFNRFNPDIVVFDMMYLDKKVFGLMKSNAMSVCLSPLFSCISKVDMVFHRTEVVDDKWKSKGGIPKYFCGLEYSIIPASCRRIPLEIYRHNLRQKALSIAVSMGGTDAANKTLELLSVIKHMPEKLLLWVLLGEGYSHSYQELVDLMKDSKHEIILAKTNDSMWHILNKCSLAILAGGTTTYESVYAGLPSINTLETKQHYFIIKELIDKKVIECSGTDFKKSLDNMHHYIKKYYYNRSALLKMHMKSKSLIDGKGCSRIFEEIKEYYNELYMRG